MVGTSLTLLCPRYDSRSRRSTPERGLPLRAGCCEIAHQLLARIGAKALAVPHFRRSPPARLDAGHVGQFMRDTLVAVDAGLIPGHQKLAVDFRGPSGLLGEIHG